LVDRVCDRDAECRAVFPHRNSEHHTTDIVAGPAARVEGCRRSASVDDGRRRSPGWGRTRVVSLTAGRSGEDRPRLPVRHPQRPGRWNRGARVWGSHHTGDSGYLRLYLAQLRKKLESHPSEPRHLLTEPGRGYRLVTDGG
ncbi:hypothetical protein ELQ92_12845, partial [Labedella populi]